MAMWSAVFLLAVAGTAVFADPSFTFPEIARGASRIVSGWEAEEGQFPHQLSLRMVSPVGGVSACGGTIISPEWGLTAAHCTATRVSIVIRAGVVNLTQPAYIFDTTEYYNHPLYNESMQSIVQPHDIGLLGFGRVLDFDDIVGPIRLQPTFAMNKNYAGEQAIASGWGRTWTQGSSPENLNWVYLNITSNFECLVSYGGSPIIADSTICARGYNVTSQSTCQGDSGGPLTIVDEDGQLTQVGVTSFVSGTGCHTDVPAGFIRPGHYHAWFKNVTGINFDWEPATTVAPEEPSSTTVAPEETSSTTAASEETTEASESSESESSESSESESSESSESESSESSESDSSESSESSESDESTSSS